MNVARLVGLMAGLPVETTAMTVNRFCSSGLQAVDTLIGRIARGQIDIGLAGGVDSMSMIPMGGARISLPPELALEYPQAFTGMGVTAEIVARKWDVSRQAMDELAVRSHRNAAEAWKANRFVDEVVPIRTKVLENNEAKEVLLERDELVRADTTMEGLAALKPAFDPTGSVTPGNSSPLTDGAAVLMLMAKEVAEKRGIRPLGYMREFQVAGVPPDVMGIGPVPAIRKLMAKTGKTVDDIDLFEINEAFAAQAVYCQRELKVPSERLNVNGGGIAIGHPLGATGARQTLTILLEMQRRKARWGVVSMCIGGGMGAAALFERA